MKTNTPGSIYSIATARKSPSTNLMKNSTLSLRSNYSQNPGITQKKSLTTSKLLLLSKQLSLERNDPSNFMDYTSKRKSIRNTDQHMFKKISPVKYKSGRKAFNNLDDMLPHMDVKAIEEVINRSRLAEFNSLSEK